MKPGDIRRVGWALSSVVVLAVGLLIVPVGAADRVTAVVSPGDPMLRGPVKPVHEVDLPAPLGAVVADVLVEDTQLVKADQVLAQMDDRVQQGEVAVKKIEIAYQQAQLDEAAETLKNYNEVKAEGAAQDFEIRKAELAKVSKDMAVEVARKNYDLELVKLDQFKIKAPMDGEVRQVKAKKGARLNAGDPAMTFVSRYQLEAHLDLPVALMKELRVGENYLFNAGSPVDRQLTARLKTLDRNITFASRTFRCVFLIDNQDLKLPSGFEVTLVWPQPGQAATAKSQ